MGVVERSTDWLEWAGILGLLSGVLGAQRTAPDRPEGLYDLAKVRVVGSNLVVRSKEFLVRGPLRWASACFLTGTDSRHGFDPTESYGSVIISVPDLDGWYGDIVERLRGELGRVPSSGIPRVLRPRKKLGTVRGFTIVDPGGNFLRFYPDGETKQGTGSSTGLERVVENAAKSADVKGDDTHGRKILTAGLRRYPKADPSSLVQAWCYLAELEVRLGDLPAARGAYLRATAAATDPPDDQMRSELEHIRQILPGVDRGSPARPERGRPNGDQVSTVAPNK